MCDVQIAHTIIKPEVSYCLLDKIVPFVCTGKFSYKLELMRLSASKGVDRQITQFSVIDMEMSVALITKQHLKLFNKPCTGNGNCPMLDTREIQDASMQY